MMLICYLDESGNTGFRLDDTNQPFHVIAAVIVREDRVREMTSQLDYLASQAPTLEPLTEYRGSELFGGSGNWKGVAPTQRIEEYAKALAVLGKVEAGVVYSSINKPALEKKQYNPKPNPHLIALQFLIEKLEKWIKGPDIQKDVLSQRALLVADENHEQEQYSIDLISEMQAAGGPIGAIYGLDITPDHLVDTIYFDRSERNRGIQLADLVAYILNRHQKARQCPGTYLWEATINKLMLDNVSGQLRTWREPWPSTFQR